jgi:hypothetical protein
VSGARAMGKRFVKRLLQAAGILLVLLSCAVLVGPLLRLLRRHAPDPLTRLLELADEKAWLNDWVEAAPLYQKVEELSAYSERIRAVRSMLE